MQIPSPLDKLPHPTHNLWIKRDDLIHPIICGNKRRKISGYLQTHFPDTTTNKTKSATDHKTTSSCRGTRWLPRFDLFGSFLYQGKNKQKYTSIMTFGGAYSNHLRAIAHTGKIYHIPTIGIVRGEELTTKSLNNNLQFCQDQGMELHFIDRQNYRKIKRSTNTRNLKHFTHLTDTNTLIIPEGGCGREGVIGTHNIIREISEQYKMSTSVYLCIEAGTGTTAAGCIQAIKKNGLDRKVVVIPVLHDLSTIESTIQAHTSPSSKEQYEIITGYEHGGYAKTTPKLLNFIDQRKTNHNIHIEPTYSGKLMYAVEDLIQQGHFLPDATIIIYHSGY